MSLPQNLLVGPLECTWQQTFLRKVRTTDPVRTGRNRQTWDASIVPQEDSIVAGLLNLLPFVGGSAYGTPRNVVILLALLVYPFKVASKPAGWEFNNASEM